MSDHTYVGNRIVKATFSTKCGDGQVVALTVKFDYSSMSEADLYVRASNNGTVIQFQNNVLRKITHTEAKSRFDGKTLDALTCVKPGAPDPKAAFKAQFAVASPEERAKLIADLQAEAERLANEENEDNETNETE